MLGLPPRNEPRTTRPERQGEERSSRDDPTSLNSLLSLSPSNPLLVVSVTTVFLSTTYFSYHRFYKRIRNVEELTRRDFYPANNRRLKGVVTSVGDADNFRLWHRPLLRTWQTVPHKRSQLKDETIHVRLAGVDAPELAHFGKPAQPFSSEALELRGKTKQNRLTKTLMGKTVTVELHQRDRYNRVVGMAYVRQKLFFKTNVSEILLNAGLATVYRQAGAVHGGKLERFERLEKKAQSRKLGMWSLGSKKYESPAEYKRRTSSND